MSPMLVRCAGEYRTDLMAGCGEWVMAKNGSSVLTPKEYDEINIPRINRNAGAKYVHDVWSAERRSANPSLAILRRRVNSSAIMIPRRIKASIPLNHGCRTIGRHGVAGLGLEGIYISSIRNHNRMLTKLQNARLAFPHCVDLQSQSVPHFAPQTRSSQAQPVSQTRSSSLCL